MKKKNKTTDHWRQGDVLIRRISKLPEGAIARAVTEPRLVLAYGEVTGHAHAIAISQIAPEALLYDKGEEFFLHADGTVTLRHEEHAPIELPAGDYQVLHQIEYTPEELRQVAD